MNAKLCWRKEIGMKRFELVEWYIPRYKGTGVTVERATEFEFGNGDRAAAFDLSDGTHWFSDDMLTVRVGESLVDLEIDYCGDSGWVIVEEDGVRRRIEWLEDASEWDPVAIKKAAVADKLICQTFREGYTIDQVGDTMTVGELIDFLSRYGEDTLVYLDFDNGYTYGGIREHLFRASHDGDCDDG